MPLLSTAFAAGAEDDDVPVERGAEAEEARLVPVAWEVAFPEAAAVVCPVLRGALVSLVRVVKPEVSDDPAGTVELPVGAAVALAVELEKC